MTYTTPPLFTEREETPPTVKILLYLTLGISLGSALLNPLFIHVLGLPGTQEILSLSLPGIFHYFFWGPLTYLFVHPLSGGISLFYLLSLALNLFLLWFAGSAIHREIGSRPLLKLYLGSGITAGIVALAAMFFLGHLYPYAGPTPAIYALLIAWSMHFPEVELLFFLLFPMKSRWLIFGIIAIDSLINLSNGYFIDLIAHLSGALFGYGFGLLSCGLKGPFPQTHRFDQWIQNLAANGITIATSTAKTVKGKSSAQSKIFDFQTGEPIMSDEDFLDKTLEKISREGEASLTQEERKRLDKISGSRKSKHISHTSKQDF